MKFISNCVSHSTVRSVPKKSLRLTVCHEFCLENFKILLSRFWWYAGLESKWTVASNNAPTLEKTLWGKWIWHSILIYIQIYFIWKCITVKIVCAIFLRDLVDKIFLMAVNERNTNGIQKCIDYGLRLKHAGSWDYLSSTLWVPSTSVLVRPSLISINNGYGGGWTF